ncbi:MAG: PA14 domain-containing protein, partial [Planctomycetota bacterium]
GYGRGEYNLTSEGEILFLNAVQYMLGMLQRLKASSPEPKDGTLHPESWANLEWAAGDTAVSHDFYFGTSFNDVNDGAADTFQGNLTDNFAIVGFFGFPAPEGLAAGTTYYWRIDEVEADGTVHEGDTWSFLVPPKEAYNPVPADGAKFIDTNADLTWTGGWGAKLHAVYFGDNFEDVNNADGGPPQGLTSFDPGQLDIGKEYYWRVDEFDGFTSHRGEVWSFTTVTPGGGVRAQYFRSVDLTGVAAIDRVDPEIDFDWADDTPDPMLQNDEFSIRWAGELEVEFSEPYTFYANTDDGVRLWVNDELVINRWVDRRAATEAKGTIELIGGQRCSLVMEYYDSGGVAIAQLSWESPTIEKQIIPQAALSLPVRASGPNPRNGATGARTTPVLTWNPGDNAASHEVYFGTDADAVLNASKSSPEYKGSKSLGDESYDPGKLAWDTPYFWRIDEVNNVHPDSPWTGSVWSFTTGDFLVVDDFETYTDNDPAGEAIWQHWIDGYGVDDNGGQVGYLMPTYVELTIVHGGRQSMPFTYTNTAGVANSQAELKLTAPRDWTEGGVAELSIWFRGNPASVGSFTEGPAGTYTMTGSGVDIWADADEFHYAYKTLSGNGSITAKVESLVNTDPFAKVGVMVRNSLDADAANVALLLTPENGVRFQYRSNAGDVTDREFDDTLAAPYWIRLERDPGGSFRGYTSADGASWQQMPLRPAVVMGTDVYIGLAVTSHNVDATCEAVFSNVTTTGPVAGQWINQDIGIASNAAEPLYVAVSNATGAPATVAHDNPAAATIDSWTEWIIPLQAFSDKGINLTDVDSIAIGLGANSGVPSAGGSGTIYFDDIRLYRPR